MPHIRTSESEKFKVILWMIPQKYFWVEVEMGNRDSFWGQTMSVRVHAHSCTCVYVCVVYVAKQNWNLNQISCSSILLHR